MATQSGRMPRTCERPPDSQAPHLVNIVVCHGFVIRLGVEPTPAATYPFPGAPLALSARVRYSGSGPARPLVRPSAEVSSRGLQDV